MSEQPTAAQIFHKLADDIEAYYDTIENEREAVVDAFQNAETPSQEPDTVKVCEALVAFSARLDAAYETAAAGLDALGGSVMVVNEVPITSACLRLEARVAKLLSDGWLAGRVELWRELANDLAVAEEESHA